MTFREWIQSLPKAAVLRGEGWEQSPEDLEAEAVRVLGSEFLDHDGLGHGGEIGTCPPMAAWWWGDDTEPTFVVVRGDSYNGR